ncbi:MAG: restriction endonuclease subunit R, partial [Chthoniobacterales bacterium]|nr:restriction endonuclease subunit R [Chthoniobacterales bacterium]
MHLNYRQFLHYAEEPPDNILLITPNAGLTDQHLEEMRLSGIPCERFTAGESGLGLTLPDTVRVVEITKLTRNKKGGGESVDVESFEGRSLIFVDEGHKGAGDGKDSNLDKAWRPLRNRLADKGFTFEYSATFGQAIQASKSEDLAEEYGKAILFDYSYRHFYEDGYGKDFRILNLKNQTGEYTDLLLLGNLLSFHEQRRYYAAHRDALKPYKLTPPLWVFAGSSVNKERGDVLTVVSFLQRFLKNEAGWSVQTIEKLLRGETELRDGDDRDAFTGRFGYLKDGSPAREVFEDILWEVFHAGAGGALRVADIKGSEGELGLKVSGAERYFGLIYIGDTNAFKKLLEAGAPEVVVEEDAFAGGLFREVEEADSQVNVLIGAKKFIEGWSSWRVSNMGLLNIGKSEGSQIIQLFGRGVRLKGQDYSLKRSSFVGSPEDHPACIDLLETLNIFAVEANYMVEFRKYLEREGVDPGGYEEIPFPIHREEALIGEGLYVPAVPDGREFAENDYIVLDETEDIKVNLDLSIRTESMRMEDGGVSTVAAKAGRGRLIGNRYLSMLDWPRIHLDLLDYKDSKKFHNLRIPPDASRRIMTKHDPDASYNLIADDALFEPESFAGLAALQDAVRSILRKYVDRFYGVRQQRWDSENMVLRELTSEHPNFADYTVKIKTSEERLVEEVKALANRVDGDGDAGSLPNIHFDRHLYQPLLKDRGEEVKVSPPGLNESEEEFISALERYCRKENGGASGKDLFLLRNLTRSKGVGFFNTSGFYPDFILWVKSADGSQKVVFVEPHGMRNDDPPPHNEKVDLYLALRDLSDRIARRDGREVLLDSYIISATP